MIDISIEDQVSILEQEIQVCRNDCYRFKVRAQAARAIGGLSQVIEQNQNNMELQQQLIDFYEKRIAELLAPES